MQRFFKRFLGRLYYIKTGHRINWNCVEDTILFCFKHISKLFTWISVEKVRKLKNVSYTTSSKGDSYKGYYARSNRISRSSMCTHLATGAGTSWLCRALQQNSGRGSHQLQKAGGSEEMRCLHYLYMTGAPKVAWDLYTLPQHRLVSLHIITVYFSGEFFSAYCFIETGFFSLFNIMKVFGLKIDFSLTTLSCLTNSLHSRLMTFINSFAMCSVIHRMNKDFKKQS